MRLTASKLGGLVLLPNVTKNLDGFLSTSVSAKLPYLIADNICEI